MSHSFADFAVTLLWLCFAIIGFFEAGVLRLEVDGPTRMWADDESNALLGAGVVGQLALLRVTKIKQELIRSMDPVHSVEEGGCLSLKPIPIQGLSEVGVEAAPHDVGTSVRKIVSRSRSDECAWVRRSCSPSSQECSACGQIILIGRKLTRCSSRSINELISIKHWGFGDLAAYGADHVCFYLYVLWLLYGRGLQYVYAKVRSRLLASFCCPVQREAETVLIRCEPCCYLCSTGLCGPADSVVPHISCGLMFADGCVTEYVATNRNWNAVDASWLVCEYVRHDVDAAFVPKWFMWFSGCLFPYHFGADPTWSDTAGWYLRVGPMATNWNLDANCF
ncbi:hypothetical protein Nepgr_022860 [Nepenthes gracilis]|uniref:Uncharacterized protein n=1 Tax=Nepenthes gracilis TaxID=150966 RepID=A0AAD3SZU1_NEPGR|nr:hypothetical protein Nepgr_022860 [Nepenthes gracilis]